MHNRRWKKKQNCLGGTNTINGDAPYWEDLIANNDGFVHVTRLP